MRIALAQINCTVGDLDGNSRKIKQWIRKAEKSGADIVAFPEMAVTGYPPEDLLLKPAFVEDNLKKLREIVRSTRAITVITGFVDRQGKNLYNAAAVAKNGRVHGVYRKMLLPNYGVFDEKRYFKSGEKPFVFKLKGQMLGVSICEDVWFREGPVKDEARLGAK